MKMNASVAFAVLSLVFAIVLQGCVPFGMPGSGSGKDNDAKTNDDDDLITVEEATAACRGEGNFSCTGPWRKWCAQQEKECAAQGATKTVQQVKPWASAAPVPAVPSPQLPVSSCTPQCTWECEDKKCDQVCAPKCGQAVCQTRCKSFNTQSCKMKCGEKNCKVVCPKHDCPGQQCAACKTECGQPTCKMQCGDDVQDCRHVCAQPSCKWDCQKPKVCPKPVCQMKCQTPHNCLDNTHMVPQLPALEPGETAVDTFQTNAPGAAPGPAPAPAPASLLLQSSHASTMRVDITTMGKDSKLQSSQVNLQLVPMDDLVAGDMVASPTIWTRTKEIKKHKGQARESEASCANGSFQCKGDAAWCTKQEKTVCQDAEHVMVADRHGPAFLHQRSHTQGRLQA